MRSTHLAPFRSLLFLEGEPMKIWKITSEKQFFESIIKCSEDKLKKALSEKDKFYGDEIMIPKKNGFRSIYSVDKNHALFFIQRNICKNFLNNIKVSDATCGFVKNSSYYDFLDPHKDFYQNNYYLRLDLINFFGSIKKEVVSNVLDYYCQTEKEEKKKILDYLSDALTYQDNVIQGVSTSPMLSNIVFRELDIRIQKYCIKHNVRYSRYADDLLFSSPEESLLQNSFCKGISKIVNSRGFSINYDKVIKSHNYISLNGFVISDSIRISRKKLVYINRILFFLSNKENITQIEKGDISKLNLHIKNETRITHDTFSGKYELVNYLNGYRAFMISIISNSEDKKFVKKGSNMILQVERYVDILLV